MADRNLTEVLTNEDAKTICGICSVPHQVFSQTLWTIPNKTAASNTVEEVRQINYTPYAGRKTYQLIFGGAVTIESAGGSDVGGQVYIEVNGAAINNKTKFTVDRWSGNVSDGRIRIPVPITGSFIVPSDAIFPLYIKIYIEAANSGFGIVNGQGRLMITEVGE